MWIKQFVYLILQDSLTQRYDGRRSQILSLRGLMNQRLIFVKNKENWVYQIYEGNLACNTAIHLMSCFM